LCICAPVKRAADGPWDRVVEYVGNDLIAMHDKARPLSQVSEQQRWIHNEAKRKLEQVLKMMNDEIANAYSN
jgi:hypothetical protein